METPLRETGWRGSRDLWLDAAYAALIETGVDAVRILPLARDLGLSRTSFYWFFADRADLLAGLVARWRDKNTGAIESRAAAFAESLTEAMLNVFDCWLDPALFDPRFEFAIRNWALRAPEVATEIAAADVARVAALARMFTRFGCDPRGAETRARTVYLTQIGYISLRTDEDLATRLARVPAYVAIFTGQEPRPAELDRFTARHIPEISSRD